MELNKIYQGDSLTTLKTLPNNSVNCCITSPPYYGLRDYGVDGQIGLEETVIVDNKIWLFQCKRSNSIYQAIRNRHYVENRGTHGQQIHYLIIKNDEPIGIISGASAVWGVKSRDEFFGLTKENKPKGLPSIINNTVFHLELHEKNLATRVLAMWRKQIAMDWRALYGVEVHGFETFVVETDTRKGTLYKADNWIYLGETKGSTKTHNGLENKSERLETSPKLIYAYKIKGTLLSIEYKPTWRKSVPLSGGLFE